MEQPILKIGKVEYNINNFKEIYERLKLTEEQLGLYEKFSNKDYLKSNPGVPTLIVFSKSVETSI